jgi:hypothetical protein
VSRKGHFRAVVLWIVGDRRGAATRMTPSDWVAGRKLTTTHLDTPGPHALEPHFHSPTHSKAPLLVCLPPLVHFSPHNSHARIGASPSSLLAPLTALGLAHIMKPTITRDFYATLELPRTADQTAILRAYWRLARVKHPGKNPQNPNATADFQDVRAFCG